MAAALAAAAAVLAFAAISPSHDRTWQPGLTRLPRIQWDGDTFTVRDLRDFTWRADGSADELWETRTYALRQAETLWFCVSVFNPDGWRCPAHSLLSFGFADGRYLAVSVEARKEVGENYSTWKGLLKRYELMYVVGDERDLIGNRIAFRPDDVWLYPVQAEPGFVRDLLRSMLTEAEEIAARPQWYNTLTDNCTTRLRDHSEAVAPGRVPASWKVLLPGYADELLTSLHLIAGNLPLDEARRRFYIKDRAAAALASEDFSAAIRGAAGG